MRVLLFGPYPLPGKSISGGVMAVVHALARKLAQQPGLQVAVATVQPGGPRRRDEEAGLVIHRLAMPRLPRARHYRRIRRQLVDVADAFRPHILHAHGTGFYAAAGLDSSWPTLLTPHGVVYQEARRSGVSAPKAWLAWQYDALMERLVLRRAHHAIAISPYIRHAFARYRHLQWTDIPNPVADDFFEIERHPEPGRIFTPARIIPRKGVDVLIQAFAKISADFPQATLRIAGETTSAPGYVQRCRALAQAAGVSERVHFLGNLDKPALLAEYSRAAMMALPSRQETAPVAIAEALAAGCPVIAARVGGAPWMVSPAETGLLVPADDQPALAAALARLLAQPETGQAWGQRAGVVARRYHLDAVTERTIALYQTLTRTSRDQKADLTQNLLIRRE